MRLAKTASLHLEAMARSDWLSLAPNTIQNKAMANLDQTYVHACSWTRTIPEIQKIEEQPIITKINKHIVIRTVLQQGSKICNYFALTLTMATGSNDSSLDIKHSTRDFSFNSYPIHKLNISC